VVSFEIYLFWVMESAFHEKGSLKAELEAGSLRYRK
jgi:hypothetical protein